MNAFTAILLGIVQGLTEFLPVSSSGHLLLMQNIFGVSEGGSFFTVLLHLGTLAAVLVVYRKRIIELVLHPLANKLYWLWIISATLVTVVMALALDRLGVLDAADTGRALGSCFLLTAALLTLSDLMRRHYSCEMTVESMRWYHALFIGFVQGIAPLPGVSRSGATIAAASVCRMKREDAAEFSFLLSIPAILGGAVLKIPPALREGLGGGMGALECLLGVAAAAISGYFAVRFMIRLITRRSFTGFAVYTAALGAFVLLDQHLLHWINWGL